MSTKAKTAIGKSLTQGDAHSDKLQKGIVKRDGEIADLEYQLEASAERDLAVMVTGGEIVLGTAGSHLAGLFAAVEDVPSGKISWLISALTSIALPLTTPGGYGRLALALPHQFGQGGIAVSSYQKSMERRGRDEASYKRKLDDKDDELRTALSDLANMRKRESAA